MEFTPEDIKLAQSKGIKLSQLEHQLQLLRNGNVYPVLDRAARIQDGISTFSDQQEEKLIEIFDAYSSVYDWCRFIPASGAASRMFAFLVNYIENGEENEQVDLFYNSISKFPFYEKIKLDIEGKGKKETIAFVLSSDKLNLLNLPKGLIDFHKKDDKVYTAVASQLDESCYYSIVKNKGSKTYFTISNEHDEVFDDEIHKCLEESEVSLGVGYSYQSESTDTIALDENGNVFRDENGNIVFRPGGHGSLLKNLRELKEDFIFIRNIDNVLAPHNNEEYVHIHKVMGGLMIKLTRLIFSLQKQIMDGDEISPIEIAQLKMYFNFKDDVESLKKFLFRPFRIAGMVKNSGEPGGGPFWINENGIPSLQIIESAQINNNDDAQMKIFSEGTHFNPVDLCCLIKNYKGVTYDLNQFKNEDFSFISTKSVGGQTIKILEHPGLWNGSMHHWLTLFIEIPSSVFNPVKTINDLLRPNHQK